MPRIGRDHCYSKLPMKLVREVKVLAAIDGAGEGILLQCAHIMINHDSLWSLGRGTSVPDGPLL